MRSVRSLVIAGLFAGGPVALAQTPATDAAANVIAATRQALGGEKKLADVKTVVATGRTRQVRGENLVPIEFEIAIELPDRYVRKDEIPAQESGPTTVGFSGAELIQLPPPAPPPARAGAPPPTPEQQEAARRTRLVGVKQDFARLMLGLFAASSSAVPLTFSYVAKAEAPQGKADVLAVTGPDNLSARFFVNADTHVPIMITWTPTAPQRGGPGRGGPPPSRGDSAPATAGQAAATPERGAGAGREGAPSRGAPPAAPGQAAVGERGASPAREGGPPAGERGGAPGREGGPGRAGGPPGPPPESRLYYADYRDVGGIQLPFRIRRALGPDTVEETVFDGFKINSKIDPKKFEVRK